MFINRKHSEETKEKMRLAKRGKTPKNFAMLKDRAWGWSKGRSVWNAGKKGLQRHTEESRRKISEALSGAKGFWWKGGVNPEIKRIRRSLDYRLWREKVFRRDNWTCVLCGNRGGELNADHILQFAFHPDARFSIENGRTLCVPCHKRTPTYSRKSRSPTKSCGKSES